MSGAMLQNFKMLTGNSTFYNNEGFMGFVQRQKSHFFKQGNRNVNALEFTYRGICAATVVEEPFQWANEKPRTGRGFSTCRENGFLPTTPGLQLLARSELPRLGRARAFLPRAHGHA
jgi:hypothetical protein